MKEIKSTTDYAIFKQIVSNREVDPRHVKRLVKSIEKNNMLHLNAIIVNDAMEVVDGQHRLEAAEELGVPVYYVVDSEVGKAQISQLNSVKKDWSMMDYVNYWTIEKAPGFDVLSRFVSEHSYLPVSTILLLLSTDASRNTAALREGKVDVSNLEQANEVLGYVRDFRNIIDYAFSRNFMLAVFHMVKSGKYDHARMMQKLELQSRSLVKCVNTRQYRDLLEEIYNFRAHDQNKVSFRYG
ncbi:MAG: ParB/RepB/Spo0J family partition protein [Legionellaceae bacterium]|nr:ParB/RepB/Spo0J family partition protein [Legionellaceae bacterium]